MNDELKSMAQNEVWDLIELPKSCKEIDCKLVFKTKCDSKGNVEKQKAILVGKNYSNKKKKEALIIRRPSLPCPRRTLSESLWLWSHNII